MERYSSSSDFVKNGSFNDKKIGPNESKFFEIPLTIPKDTKSGNYTITIQIETTKGITADKTQIIVKESPTISQRLTENLEALLLGFGLYGVFIPIVERIIEITKIFHIRGSQKNWSPSWLFGGHHKEEKIEPEEANKSLVIIRDAVLKDKAVKDYFAPKIDLSDYFELFIEKLNKLDDSKMQHINKTDVVKKLNESKSLLKRGYSTLRLDNTVYNNMISNIVQEYVAYLREIMKNNEIKTIIDNTLGKNEAEWNTKLSKVIENKVSDLINNQIGAEILYQTFGKPFDKLIIKNSEKISKHEKTFELILLAVGIGIGAIISSFLSFGAHFGILQILEIPGEYQWADAIIGAFAIGSGTKPTHDVIEWIRKVSGK